MWIGYERKRGKLADLNAFLRGKSDRFSLVAGRTGILSEVKFVITLDTDTSTSNGKPHVAMLSVHTSPQDAPGSGDSGGMNVYIQS